MGTVYEAAGGRHGLQLLAVAWHARMLADEVVAHAYAHGVHPQHTERLAAYWAHALGGPPCPPGEGLDESAVVRMHRDEGGHEEMDGRAVACFEAALVDVGLDGQPVGAVLRDYFSCRTADLGRPGPADGVPDGLMPARWSWDGPVS